MRAARVLRRLQSEDHRPLPAADDGRLVARGVPGVLRLPRTAHPVLLHQGQQGLLQVRLREVGPDGTEYYMYLLEFCAI